MLSTDIQIGQIIKQKRQELGMTQTELGQKMGVGKTAVAKWEAGKVKNLKRDALPLLADILRISPLALIGINEGDNKIIATKRGTVCLNPTEKVVLKKYRQLDTDDQEEVVAIIDMKLAKASKRVKKEGVV